MKARRFLLILVAVVVLGAMVVPAQLALANHCWDGVSSYPDSLHLSNGNCPPNTPDPGSANTRGAGGGTITTFFGLLGTVTAALNVLVPFLVGLAVFIVIWGVFKYIASAAEEEKRAEARLFIVWGVVGIFAMVSVWGFVNIMVNSFNLSKSAPAERPNLPEIPGAN